MSQSEDKTDPSALVRLPPIFRGDTLQAWSLGYQDSDSSEPFLITDALVRFKDELGHEVHTWRLGENLSLGAPGIIQMAQVLDTSDWPRGCVTGHARITLDTGERFTFVTIEQQINEGAGDG